MSEQRGCTSNNTKRATMTDRQDLCLSSRMDRQLECRSEDIGSQLLSSEQPTRRDLIICVLLMDMSIDETDATSWTQKNLKLTVLTCQSGMKVQNYVQHQPTVDHTTTLYTHLTTLMSCPIAPLTEPDMDDR